MHQKKKIVAKIFNTIFDRDRSRTILSKQFRYRRYFLLDCGLEFFSEFVVQTSVINYWLHEQRSFYYLCCNNLITEQIFLSANQVPKGKGNKCNSEGRPGLLKTCNMERFTNLVNVFQQNLKNCWFLSFFF